jgi:hypothetical protein
MGGEITPNLRYSAVCCMVVDFRLVRVPANDGPIFNVETGHMKMPMIISRSLISHPKMDFYLKVP